MRDLYNLSNTLIPVGVSCSLIQVWTTAAVNWIVVGIPEHPPHDRIHPREEEERHKADMAEWNLVTMFSVRRHEQAYYPCGVKSDDE